jgi:hypothetical protein
MNEVTVSNDPMKEFRERVAAKLREDIGAMLPDEALAAMVQQAVRDQFFKPRTIKDGHFHERIEPSWFVAEVTKSAEPVIKAIIEAYVKENHDVIEKAVKEFLDEKYMAFVAFAALRVSTNEDFMTMANEIVTRLRQNY